MGFMEFISTYLLDIAIAIISLTVLIGSFYKPTHRYFRWLVGLTLAGATVLLVKNVDFFNFVEFYVHNFFQSLSFESLFQLIYSANGKADLIGSEGYYALYNLSMLGIIALVVFIITNVFMHFGYKARVKALLKKGKYVYNKPLCSFILALLIVIICLIGTSFILSINYNGICYTETSLILYNIKINMVNLLDGLSSTIPFIKPYDFYLDMLSKVEIGSYK